MAVEGGITGRTELVAGAAIVDVTLSLDTSAYASGDVLADTQEIANAVRTAGGTAILQSVMVLDENNQGVAFTLYFFNANRSLGTENAAPNITVANARDLLGWVDVFTSDYKTLNVSKVATVRGIGLPVKAASASTSLYVGVVNGTGTPTFTASGLRLRLGFLQD